MFTHEPPLRIDAPDTTPEQIKKCEGELVKEVFKLWDDKEKDVRDSVVECAGRLMGRGSGVAHPAHAAVLSKMDALDKKRAAKVKSSLRGHVF